MNFQTAMKTKVLLLSTFALGVVSAFLPNVARSEKCETSFRHVPEIKLSFDPDQIQTSSDGKTTLVRKDNFLLVYARENGQWRLNHVESMSDGDQQYSNVRVVLSGEGNRIEKVAGSPSRGRQLRTAEVSNLLAVFGEGSRLRYSADGQRQYFFTESAYVEVNFVSNEVKYVNRLPRQDWRVAKFDAVKFGRNSSRSNRSVETSPEILVTLSEGGALRVTNIANQENLVEAGVTNASGHLSLPLSNFYVSPPTKNKDTKEITVKVRGLVKPREGISQPRIVEFVFTLHPSTSVPRLESTRLFELGTQLSDSFVQQQLMRFSHPTLFSSN